MTDGDEDVAEKLGQSLSWSYNGMLSGKEDVDSSMRMRC
jgi:hypothetical protein